MHPPDDITTVAVHRGLGGFRYGQKGRNPFVAAGRSFAYGVGWLVGMCALGLFFKWLNLGPLLLLAVPFLAGAVVAWIKAIRHLFAGFTAAYLYEDGLVHVHNGTTRAIPWSAVSRLELAYFGGELASYRVVTADGVRARVAVESASGDPNLGLLLARAVEDRGLPIVPVGPSSSRAHPTKR
jgi:hypothetical protein